MQDNKAYVGQLFPRAKLFLLAISPQAILPLLLLPSSVPGRLRGRTGDNWKTLRRWVTESMGSVRAFCMAWRYWAENLEEMGAAASSVRSWEDDSTGTLIARCIRWLLSIGADRSLVMGLTDSLCSSCARFGPIPIADPLLILCRRESESRFDSLNISRFSRCDGVPEEEEAFFSASASASASLPSPKLSSAVSEESRANFTSVFTVESLEIISPHVGERPAAEEEVGDGMGEEADSDSTGTCSEQFQVARLRMSHP
mmetsp:Transcript_6556/g.10194  ORF Transcript_6556/g.10194 Transcript_6556/m.10194 type:complete len:257 (-) Transcript_6556:3141-3911(-)